MRILLALTLLVGCTGSNSLGTDASTQIDTLRNLSENHVDAVSSINSTSEIAVIEADYDADWDVAMGDMSGLMDDMMTCMGMDSDMMGSDADTTWMSDMVEHMDDLDDAHAGHGEDMASCTDMGSCLEHEDEHLADVSEHLDAMEVGMNSWDAELDCDKDQ